ncbi:MAG: site-2 protease family protein, partial [Acidobacteria bacterium]|nr:site-2 protease family protein [Acidobacteriota bacterium]
MLTLIAFVLVVGTLVVVHEFGHYLVARFIGVRVETFSIGFPPNVYRRRIGDTEWTIGLLPLGGYVKMAGDAPGYGSDDPAELQNRTRGERLAILFAGPAMNFVLAVAILAGLFYVG